MIQKLFAPNQPESGRLDTGSDVQKQSNDVTEARNQALSDNFTAKMRAGEVTRDDVKNVLGEGKMQQLAQETAAQLEALNKALSQ